MSEIEGRRYDIRDDLRNTLSDYDRARYEKYLEQQRNQEMQRNPRSTVVSSFDILPLQQWSVH